MNNNELKTLVQQKYGEIAQSSDCCSSSCCGTGSDSKVDYSIMSDDYSHIEGYIPDADLGLGCGLPTEFAAIYEGATVLDLGSGAGNDAFVARKIVGETGKVIGLDFTEKMLEKAKQNCSKLGYSNVEFISGDIENMPIDSDSVDIVISNCVLNLVPDKVKAFSEIYRVLKSGGHFCVSDIVVNGELPEEIQKAAELYAGCVSGAIQYDEYLKIISETGFSDTSVAKQKEISVPDSIFLEFMDNEKLEKFKNEDTKILSITVKSFKK